MSEFPGSGTMLARLLGRRGLDMPGVALRAGAAPSEVQAVIGGAVPGGPFLRRLAPVLGWHAADLFVVAGVPVPQDLAPLEPGAGDLAARLARDAMGLPPGSRARLVEFVRALPQQDRTQPVPPEPESYRQFAPGLGSALVRMLRNRNLGWLPATELLYRAGGPVLSGSMIGSVGLGRKDVTPRLLGSFAIVLGIPAGDLAAIGGMDLPDPAAPADPAAADAGVLAWEARRLTRWQVQQARDEADLIRQG